jgi:CYTH domain-containing protein
VSIHSKKHATEIERRWRVTKIDLRTLPKTPRKTWHILQGYLELKPPAPSPRVRIILNGAGTGSMAIKSGKGMVRKEIDRPIPLDLAQAIMAICQLKVSKTRRFIGPWELDSFHGPLEGLLILEREFTSRAIATRASLPAWVLEATEVTDIISNRDLARLAVKLAITGGDPNKAVDRIISTQTKKRRM